MKKPKRRPTYLWQVWEDGSLHASGKITKEFDFIEGFDDPADDPKDGEIGYYNHMTNEEYWGHVDPVDAFQAAINKVKRRMSEDRKKLKHLKKRMEGRLYNKVERK